VKWLIDEMMPPGLAEELSALGHDATSVHELGLLGASDDAVFDVAVREHRVIVTENFGDFARLVDRQRSTETAGTAVVFVRKRDFVRRGGLAVQIARRLHRWAELDSTPYPGVHWP